MSDDEQKKSLLANEGGFQEVSTEKKPMDKKAKMLLISFCAMLVVSVGNRVMGILSQGRESPMQNYPLVSPSLPIRILCM